MIQLNTLLSVIDNSGAKTSKCIKVMGGSSSGTIGDICVVSTQKVIANRKIQSGEVHRALIVRQKKNKQRKDSSFISFSNSSVVLLNSKNVPIGSRIFGLLPRELRRKKFMKIISLSQGII